MFNSYEFIFAGLPSSMFGLYICDIAGANHGDNPFGPKAEIIETRIPGRVRPLYFGVDYNKTPLSFNLIFGSTRELDRWQLEEVANWLTGYQNYQWLSIEQRDLAHVRFRCLITELEPISVGWVPVAFQAKVVCDCPYAYGYPFKEDFSVSGSRDLYICNEGSAREVCYPQMTIITSSGCTKVQIDNSDDGRSFVLDELPEGGTTIYIDNENCIIQDLISRRDLYKGFNDTFLKLLPGDNHLTISGSGQYQITGSYYHNVGA